jgi:hypothetical protein
MLSKLAGMTLLLGMVSVHADPKISVKRSPLPKAPSKMAPSAGNKLDTAQIHQTYLDGDFDQAIELIEEAQKYGGPFSHQDSIFIFKHLGVMHAAKYETREKGKHYMVQLLNVEPTAKILDMYASDMIYMIFKNIKDELDASRPLTASPDSKHPIAEGGKLKKQRRYAWIGWTAGALAAVGGVAITMHILEEERTTKNVNTSDE